MANQYHDEQGKFCSKGDMKNAISKALSSGDQNTYLRLKEDYEKAEQSESRNKFVDDALRSSVSRRPKFEPEPTDRKIGRGFARDHVEKDGIYTDYLDKRGRNIGSVSLKDDQWIAGGHEYDLNYHRRPTTIGVFGSKKEAEEMIIKSNPNSFGIF